jgi:hypothetical protein
MPFFADVQAAVLYPLNLILTPFADKEWLSPLLVEYQIILHIAIGGLGMFLLCRELGCRSVSAVFAGITFMFCGFLTTHIFHDNLIHTAVWFPLIILLVKKAFDRGSLISAALAAVVLALTFLAGYPQLMLHGYYVLGALFLFLLFFAIRRKMPVPALAGRGGLFVVLVALSLGMSAIQLLPTKELGDNSTRPTISFHDACEGSLHPYRLVTLVAPKFFGTPTTGYWGISANDVNGGMHNYWETAIYCGILPLILAVLAAVFVRQPLVWFFAGLGVIALLLAMGDSFFLYGIFFKLLPGLDRFREPGRFAFVFTIAVAALAAWGLQWLLSTDWSERKKQARTIERILLGLCGLSFLAALLASAGMLKESVTVFMVNSGAFGSNAAALQQHVEQVIYPQVSAALWFCFLFTLLSSATVIGRLRNLLPAGAVGVAACTVLFLDLMVFGYGYAAGKQNPNWVYAKTTLIASLQQQLQQEYFRVNSRDSSPGTDDLGGRHMAFQKNQGSVSRIFLMEGYNPLRLKRQLVDRAKKTLDILNVKYAIAVNEQAGTMGFAYNQGYLPRARMVYDWAVEPEESRILPLLHAEGFDHTRKVILEKQPAIAPAAATDSTAAGSASITRYGLNGITTDVSGSRDGLLVLSEIDYPAWKATVDGKPAEILRADYALRAIAVPAGKHQVVCFWESKVFSQGLRISIIATILTGVLFAAGLFFTRRQSAGEAGKTA